MHTIFTASAVLTAALTSAHNFTHGLTGLSPLLLTHSGITPSTIQQPSSGSSGQRFVVCFESDQLKMQTGSATANGAELEPARVVFDENHSPRGFEDAGASMHCRGLLKGRRRFSLLCSKSTIFSRTCVEINK